MKKLFVETYGWPLFRDGDTSSGRSYGFSSVGGRIADGVEQVQYLTSSEKKI